MCQVLKIDQVQFKVRNLTQVEAGGIVVLTCSHHVADRCQFTEGGVVGQNGLNGHLIGSTADVSLLTEVAETRHGHQDRLSVWTPQKQVETYFQLCLCLPANGNTATHSGTLLQRSRIKHTICTTFVTQTGCYTNS